MRFEGASPGGAASVSRCLIDSVFLGQVEIVFFAELRGIREVLEGRGGGKIRPRNCCCNEINSNYGVI